MGGLEKGNKGCDPYLLEKTIPVVMESMRSLDIIFLMVTSSANKIVLRENDTKKDLKYLEEIDNIFKEIYSRYRKDGCSAFFPKNDSPAIIDLHGTPEERIAIAKLYVTPDGGLYGEDQAIFNPQDLLKMEDLIKDQKQALAAENKEKELYRKFGI